MEPAGSSSPRVRKPRQSFTEIMETATSCGVTCCYSDHVHKRFDIDCELAKKQKLNGFTLRKDAAGMSKL
jgi:hypothetical protein